MSRLGTSRSRDLGDPNLTTYIPYALDGNLGPIWNKILSSLPDDGWAAFLDHDAMFTTPIWYRQVVRAIKEQPLGTFSCIANRIGQSSRWQSVNRKKTFDLIGPFPDGLRGLDNALHVRLRLKGLKLFCINGLYLYHWYRADGVCPVAGSLCYHYMNDLQPA